PVQVNRQRHQAAITHPQWADAMALLMRRYLAKERHFRWHDSGDLASVDHLRKIVTIAERTPWLRHWLPTHEGEIVADFVLGGGVIPANLTIRLSADYIGVAADVPGILRDKVTTSTAHTTIGAPVAGAIECRAHERDHECGPCRACWSPNAAAISYPVTGPALVTIRSRPR
ncbi:MAG TPA: hypothetical protein VEB66_18080, partial [Opitutaceae bacterium]|nr:hypothetical protein [Opitutaceae bacterium]